MTLARRRLRPTSMRPRSVGQCGVAALRAACPICAVPEGTQMAEGLRAGALVLIVVTAAVMGSLAACAVRLWRAERDNR